MKVVKFFQSAGLTAVICAVLSLGVVAQKTAPQKRERSAKAKTETSEDKIVDKIASPETKSEEAAIISYYKNYLDNYTLGPTDVITVEVFGQCPNYCKSNVTIPPTGKISYPLIKGGVFAAGRTIEQIEEEVAKKLDEYIIDPQVSVTLIKALSVRYSVLGKVTAPGVRVLERRITVYEAIAEAGGILKEGNKKKVVLYRYNPQGNLTSQIVNLTNIEGGKAPMIEIQPGDQIFVPDSKTNLDTVFKVLNKVALVRLLFGSPF